MKEFFTRNAAVLFGLGIAAVSLIVILLALLYNAYQFQIETLNRYDKTTNSDKEMPGPHGHITARSEQEIIELYNKTPHIIGGWVSLLQYTKTQNPVIFSWSTSPVITDTLLAYKNMQESGKGFSSDELNRDSAKSMLNSQEAKTGLVRCGPLSGTNLLKVSPNLGETAKGVCRATIPPFDENVNIGLVALVDIDATENSPQIQAVRRTLLQLQIDIFNRDYQGRETWARELTR